MGYKTYGFFIEGVLPDSFTGMPTIFGADNNWIGQSQYITINGNAHRWISNVCIDFPSFSGSEIDIFTGQLQAGSVKQRLTASPLMGRTFMAQAISRLNVAVLAAPLSKTDTQMTLTATTGFVIGGFLYINEEVIRVDSFDSGTTFNITRGIGQTEPIDHLTGDYLYDRINYWAGRRISFVELSLPNSFSLPVTPTSTTIIWTGFITDNPVSTKSTNTIELSADATVDVLRKIEINQTPRQVTFTSESYNDDTIVLSRLATSGNISRVQKLQNVVGYSRRFYYELNDSGAVVLAGDDFGNFYYSYDQVQLGSPSFNLQDKIGVELLVISKDQDDLANFIYASPTVFCDYPYHPLTIAAALLFSTTSPEQDPANFDVLHPNWSCQIGFIAKLQEWKDLIDETYWLEIDEIILGSGGEKVDVWNYVVQSLLPAFGFQITQDRDGYLIPVKVGILDVEEYYNSVIVQPLPEKWEWRPYTASVLDGMTITVGDRPWETGRTVTVTGRSEDDRTGDGQSRSGRVSRIINPKFNDNNWPFFKEINAESVSIAYGLERLAWRFDGLPSVSFELDISVYQPYLGETLRLTRPDGLVSDILFDQEGARANDWAAVPFLAQITAIKPDVKRGVFVVEAILALYAYGAYAKWRAPSARIKSRVGVGQYIIEGLTSDFADNKSDALNFFVGDELALYTKSLDIKSTTLVNILSIAPSGSDYLIQLNVDFGTIGVAGDWLMLADSNIYENSLAVSPDEPYPFVFMTDLATLPRPGFATTDADTFS